LEKYAKDKESARSDSVDVYAVAKSCPSGRNTNLAVLKYCLPKGIPIMVMQKTTPRINRDNAYSQPQRMAHIKLSSDLYQTFLDSITFFPIGQK